MTDPGDSGNNSGGTSDSSGRVPSGGATRSGRAPKFTAEDAVHAALDLGVNDFTMSRVASALHVTTPALYRLYPSRDTLLDACLREIAGQVPPLPDTGDWRDLLEHLAEVEWTLFTRYPGLDTVFTTYARPIRSIYPEHTLFYRRLVSHGFSLRQATFAMVYITNLTVPAVAHLHRQLSEYLKDLGSPDARVFRADEGRLITDADDLVESSHRQWQLNTGFFLDHLVAVSPHWPEQVGPFADIREDRQED